MPSINVQIGPTGPMLDALVHVSAAREAALRGANQPIPNSVLARFLVDTGASNTCLDPSILKTLALTPTGIAQMHTPSTNGQPTMASQYDVRIVLLNQAGIRPFDAVPVMACNLLAQGFTGLLGRDILAHCVLVFNGTMNLYTLSF